MGRISLLRACDDLLVDIKVKHENKGHEMDWKFMSVLLDLFCAFGKKKLSRSNSKDYLQNKVISRSLYC